MLKTLSLIYFSCVVSITIYAAKTQDGMLLPCADKTAGVPEQTVLSPEEKKQEKIYNQNALNLKRRLSEAQQLFRTGKVKDGNTNVNIFESVFTIKDKLSSGSGFYTSLWGIPVGITNAHVIAGMQKPTVMDGKGNSYEIKSMLVLTDRDIVIFELKNPGGLKPIPMSYHVSTVPNNSTVYAYGNSLGSGVITKLDGKLQGIGPKKIEMNAGIVPGNSGGPVIYQNKVIGVATCMTKSLSGDWRLEGTRFANKTNFWGTQTQSGVRRFATRIDSTSLGNIKILNPISSTQEQEIIQELIGANNAAWKYLNEKLTSLPQTPNFSQETFQKSIFQDEKFKEKLESCYARMRFNPNSYSTDNRLLKDAITKQLNIYRIFSCLWDFQELFDCQEPNFKADFAGVIKNLKTYYQRAPKCKYCKGRGFLIIEKVVSPHDSSLGKNYRDSSKLASRYKTVNEECPYCNGKGTRNISPYYYRLINKNYADKIYKPLDISFLGFTPGANLSESVDEMRRMLFSHRYRSDINNTYFYKKNPRFPLSTSTKLNFVFGKLQEIEIHFPASNGLYQQLKNRLEDKYGKVSWETTEAIAFCQIDKPDYIIRLGNMPNGNKLDIIVNCRHKKLSNARFLFNKLRRKTSVVKSFKIDTKQKKNTDTGF